MNLYNWQDSYEQDTIGATTFVKGILKFLRDGEPYYYEPDGGYSGHINSFDGPLGWVQILSCGAAWEYEESYGPIEIRVIYLGHIVFYATFLGKPGSKFHVVTNERGNWTNCVCNYYNYGDPYKREK